MSHVFFPVGPNHVRHTHPLPRRVDDAARLFEAVAGPAQVAVLHALGARPHRPHELDALLGPSDARAAVASLKDAGLVFGDDASTLTPRGRNLWMAVRTLLR